jgi:hypothetical protein
MKIVKFEHGNPEMFRLLGVYFCSKDVHKELGGPLYSSPGCTWFVALEYQPDDKGLQEEVVLGFCSMRETESSVWFDYDYVKPTHRGKGISTALSEARNKDAVAKPVMVCVKSERWEKHYLPRGWQVKIKRGSWVYGVRTA